MRSEQSEQFLSVFPNSSELLTLPRGSVLYICGAGGKTTLLHALADYYVRQGFRVLLTTSTHMMKEPGLCTTIDEARKSLNESGFAFLGREDPKNPMKIIGPEQTLYLEVKGLCDYIFVEADGARHKKVKVPYSHEPVIASDASCIAVLYGARASGMTIAEAAYNPEGMIEALSHAGMESLLQMGQQTILTEPMILEALTNTYLPKISQICPGVPVLIVKSYAEAEH